MEKSLYIFMLMLLSTLLLFPSLYFSTSVHPNRCFQDDEKTLLEIKQHFNNDPSEFSTWTPGTDCCNWDSVLCKKLPNTTTHRVYFLELNEVVGTIPSAIGDLTFLETIFIRNSPNVTGNIPQSITKLANLQFIDFNANNLTGPVPDFLNKLTKLLGLELNNNHLTGPIPNFLSLSELSELDLSNNLLTGNIPTYLARLPRLKDLDLSGNQLTGTIPANLGSLPKLASLTLSSNMLSGPIPRSLGNLNFEILVLTGNRLTGDASFLFGQNKTNLAHMLLGSNKLSFDLGNVVLPVGGLNPSILMLDLSHNMIFGSIPVWIGEAPSLYELDLSYNQLCGPIPSAIGRQTDRFASFMFEHNKCLCGAPLSPCKP